ncbi:efflux RND transporter permease subunit [Marinobacter sp. CHS3-4]|uniref:efflux RND transporter permease subunit n=1 Tax=Marinobacter sp. CHS3-4 TaxID=3045174 RepID=UPI0024B500B0|nr:efflux RND transporter permease subunit [Marinobacter sp. CHS3-4]MDI9246396.1 efflux RND transporter permease subunit [Marinobacter sp. CHS3-4]
MSEARRRKGWVGPIEWMARNSIAANLIMILLLAGGLWMATQVQKEVFPQFQLDIVQVRVSYPGAAPEEVEQGILLPVEEAIQGIQSIEEMTSTAREGSGNIQLELVSGTNRMQALQDIEQAVDRIRTFPEQAEEPRVRLITPTRDVMELTLYGDVDIWTLRQLGEQVRNRLLAENAITQAVIDDVPAYVTSVEIPLEILRKYDLTLAEVASRIGQSSEDIAAGSMATGNGDILLRLKDRKQWADAFENIVILNAESGAAVTLGEIATVRDGFEEGGFHSRFNALPSVEIEIFRTGDQSPLDIADSVEKVMAELEVTLPDAVSVRIDSNRAEHFEDRMTMLLENGVMAMVIVLVILSLFLEYRLAFWIMMGMTISFVGSVLFLPAMDVTVNMISMFGFLMVLGIVVDDAIVVGENIYEYREQGMNFMDAAIQGAKDIAGPVTFSILTNIVAFLPLLFIPGATGNFWWPLGIVIILVLAISLIEALFILPAHLAHSGQGSVTVYGHWMHGIQRVFSRGFQTVVDKGYRPLLDLALRFRYITLTTALTIMVVSGAYAISDHMGMIMMPEAPTDEIEAGIRLPTGTTAERAGELAMIITRDTQRLFEEHNLSRNVEGIKTNVRGQEFIDVELVLLPGDQRDMTVNEIIELWQNELGDFKGVDQITFEAEQGPGSWRDDISVDLSHTDIDTLARASERFVQELKKLGQTRGVNDNYSTGKPQFDISLTDEGRALGLTGADVGRQLRDAFYGSIALRQLRGINENEVRVRLPEYQRKDLHYLDNFVIRTSGGQTAGSQSVASQEVPLMDVANLTISESFRSIDRRDGRRVITVGTDVEPKSATSQVLEVIQTELLPQLRTDFPGLTWTFQGSQAELRESTAALWGGFGLAMFAIYALLAVAFSSYLQPLVVMLAIPFGAVGAIIGHMILGMELSLVSIMGIVALSGVVVNDSLIMVSYANRQRERLGPAQAIYEAGIRRFRPILLTTLTTFGGLTPIITETSLQATYLIPMAVSLGFGIVFATALILFLVPCLYLVLEDTRHWFPGTQGSLIRNP